MALLALLPHLSRIMTSVSRSLAITRCDQVIDILYTLLEKLKLFPPIEEDDAVTTAPKIVIAVPSIRSMSKRCMVLGITALYYRDALHLEQGELERKLSSATANLVQSMSLLLEKVNKVLDDLLSQRMTLIQRMKPSRSLSKSLAILNGILVSCLARMDVVVELAQLPVRTKSAFYLNQLASDLPNGLQVYELEELFDLLKKHIVKAARDKTLAMLEGGTDSDQPSNFAKSAQTNAETVKRLMERTGTPMNAIPHKRPNRAELEGFVSRTQTTRREPNWKVSGSVDETEKASPRSPKSLPLPSPIDTLQQTPPLRKTAECWPFPSPPGYDSGSDALTISSPTRPESVRLEEIYDSYHDHGADATLGLSGVDALAALKRQPSHKKSIHQIVRIRSDSSVGRRISRTENRPRTTATDSESRTDRLLDHADKVNIMPVKPHALIPGGTTSTKTADFRMSAVRDQYY